MAQHLAQARAGHLVVGAAYQHTDLAVAISQQFAQEIAAQITGRACEENASIIAAASDIVLLISSVPRIVVAVSGS